MKNELPKFEDTVDADQLPDNNQNQDLPSFDQTEDLPSFEDTLNPEEASQPKELESGLKSIAAYKGASSGLNLLGKTYDTITNRMGKLTPDQRDIIRQNPEEYKKARVFKDTLDDYLNVVKNLRESGVDYSRIGKQSLSGNVQGSDVIKALSDIKEAPLANLLPQEDPQFIARNASLNQSEKILAKKAEIDSKLKQLSELGIESPEINAEINKLSKQSADLYSKSLSPIRPTIEDYSKATNFPKEVLLANPSLKQKRIQKELGNVLSSNVDFLKGTELSSFDVADKLIPSYQDQVNYNKMFADETTKFKAEQARNVSNFLKNLPGSETFKRGQELSARAIKAENTLEEFGISIDDNGNPYVKNQNAISNIYKKDNASQIKRLQDALDEAEKLKQIKTVGGFLPDQKVANVTSPLAKELPLSAIKEVVENSPDSTLSRIIKTSAGFSTAGPTGAIVANTVAPSSTKIQEFLTLLEANKALKLTGKVGKKLIPALAGGAVGLTAQAAEEGVDSTPTGASPTMPEYYKERGVKGFDEQQRLAENAKKKIEREDIANQMAGFNRGLISSEEMSSLSKRYKELAPDTQKRPFNQNAMIPLAPKESTKALNVQDNKDTLEELLNKFQNMTDSKAAQGQAEIINKALNGSDKEKAVAEYQLQQSPAYRQALAKKKQS